MRFNRRSPCLALGALVLMLLPAAAFGQAVTVYAEGAYTADDLAVYIYADITGDPLCSFGVSLNYDSGKLTVDTNPDKTNINKNIWFFGSSPPGEGCPNCVTSTTGKIIFIGGKLDTNNPTQGVSGTRKLLAKATFNRVPGQDTAFGIALGLGKTNPTPPPSFDNFVTSVTPATLLDGSVNFSSVTIRERGDADGNGEINVNDMRTLRQLIGVDNASPWVDCDGDGAVTVNDVRCLRQKI